MATATLRESLDGGATQYWDVRLDDGQRIRVAAVNAAAAISAAQAVGAANTLLATNRTTLQSRASAAIGTNTTYLAILSPTVAQNTAQVQALTKECSAVIRLLLDQVDSLAGA